MVTQINKQTFYPDSVGAVSNRTGVECLINSKVYHSLHDFTGIYKRIFRTGHPKNYVGCVDLMYDKLS